MTQSTNGTSGELTPELQTFNQITRRLISSYESLEKHMVELQSEMDKSCAAPAPVATGNPGVADRNWFESVPAGLVQLDANGRVNHLNAWAQELLGTIAPGITWQEVITTCFAPRNDDGHDISLKDGRRVSLATAPLPNAKGQMILIQDVTASREIQEQLGRYQRLSAMGEMAARLAHQIRTPLATALLYAGHLQQATVSDDNRQLTADKLVNRLQHMEALIRDMLLFVQGGSSGQEKINISGLFSDIALQFYNVFETRQVEYRFDIHYACNVKGNRHALLSALGNLVNNAIEHSLHQPKLTLRIQPALNNYVDIMVIDNGCGVPQDIQDRIQEPFFTTRTNGTGLGLAVVDAVARAHNGCLWFQSEAERGSVFALRLPVCMDTTHALETATSNA